MPVPIAISTRWSINRNCRTPAPFSSELQNALRYAHRLATDANDLDVAIPDLSFSGEAAWASHFNTLLYLPAIGSVVQFFAKVNLTGQRRSRHSRCRVLVDTLGRRVKAGSESAGARRSGRVDIGSECRSLAQHLAPMRLSHFGARERIKTV